MNQNSTAGARARRGAGHEPKRKRAREDRMTASRTTPKVPAKVYEPTSQEMTALEAQHARRQKEKNAPRMKVEMKGGAASLSFEHEDQGIAGTLLMEAIGTADFEFVDGLLGQLANAGKQGSVVNAKDLNFLLSVVKGIEPRDQMEAMLATQMAAVHSATMTFARRLNHVENIPQQDSAERAFNKLARTFAAQIEALKRYRSAGEQTVRVEHVTVNDGGQAIVGNVTHGGGHPEKARGNLMNTTYPFQKSPRCTATSKRTRKACQAPAVNGWTVCRFHGARGGAPTGKGNGMYRHGLYTQQAAALNSRLSDLQRESRALLRRLNP